MAVQRKCNKSRFVNGMKVSVTKNLQGIKRNEKVYIVDNIKRKRHGNHCVKVITELNSTAITVPTKYLKRNPTVKISSTKSIKKSKRIRIGAKVRVIANGYGFLAGEFGYIEQYNQAKQMALVRKAVDNLRYLVPIKNIRIINDEKN